MLETVRRLVRRNVRKTFDEKYVDYIISVQGKSILLELDYLKTHNRLDILKLDALIERELREARNYD